MVPSQAGEPGVEPFLRPGYTVNVLLLIRSTPNYSAGDRIDRKKVAGIVFPEGANGFNPDGRRG
ncbi:MAG: hypothetical protein ACREQ7_13240 [Candidatus Binatia bacterium]